VPAVDYEGERRTAVAVRELVRRGLVAAKDLSDGGFTVAAVEMSGGAVGAELALPDGVDAARALFGEWRGGFLIAVARAREREFAQICEGLPVTALGTARGSRLMISLGGKALVDEPVRELERIREGSLGWLCGA
jgi:phosphoribosylformylglycinamidine (FGAM) synthase-like enzyme